MKQLSLDQIREKLDAIPAINRGGCAIAALALKRWLNTQGRDCEIVYGYTETNSLQRNEAVLAGSEYTPAASCSHAMILMDGYYIDTEDKWDEERFIERYSYHHALPESVVVKSINQTSEWNESFCRDTQVPKIEKILNVLLTDIKH